MVYSMLSDNKLICFALFGLLLSCKGPETRNRAYTYDDRVNPPSFADFVSEAGKDYLHFKWINDSTAYQKVIVTDHPGAEPRILGSIPYPENTLDISGSKAFPDSVYLVTVDQAGRKSKPVMVRRHDDTALLASDMAKVTISEHNDGAFFVQNGNTFIPKGVNYVGLLLNDHATFEPDHFDGIIDGYYDPLTTETVMKTLKRKGYNLIRVFLKTGDRNENIWGMSGNPEAYSPELWAPYMDNVVDLVRCARKYGIYVMPTFADNERMANAYWSRPEKFGSASYQQILFSENAVEAKKEYISKFLNYIIKQPDGKELVKALFAMTLQNEFHFDWNTPPFAPIDGSYAFAYHFLGKDYDMSVAASRRELALAATANYYREMKEAVKGILPDLLVGEGTFTLAAVGKDVHSAEGLFPMDGIPDPRIPLSGLEYLKMDIDFLDFHIYKWGVPGDGYAAFSHSVSNMLLDTREAKEIRKRKPVILGEFGAFKADHTTLDEAEQFVISLRDAAMGNGFQGWCYWTIDCFEQTDIWNLMHNNGQMLDALMNE